MILNASRHTGSLWRLTALVSTLTAVYTPLSLAQGTTDKTLPPVVVTASRFPSTEATPIGATVITAQEIREAGINNVNEAVRKIGGVFGRQNLYGTQDYSLDLRGFGSTSDQNMVILVDGIRLSENELATAFTTSVPIELVDRIEIIRGGSSVLYGEGATGGIIHIITKRAPVSGTRGTVVAEVGSFDHRDVRASVARGWDGFSLDANVGVLRTDNYRDNNELDQENFSGGAQWAFSDGRFGIRIDALRQDNRFAGALSLDQFKADPRQTLTPDDFGSTDIDRYTVFAEKRIGSFELAAELSHREKEAKVNYGGLFPFNAVYDSKVTQFSPRLRHSSSEAGITNDFIFGMDFSHWERDSDNAGFTDHASQKSHAIYVRDEIRVNQLRLAAGARTEKFTKNYEEDAFGTGYKAARRVGAWDLQGSYAVLKNVEVFAKVGRSYRIANADENTLRSTLDLLEPQVSRDLELGTTIGNADRRVTVRLFQHRIKDEIFYDPTILPFGANTNLDDTRREGMEVEARARLSNAFVLSGILQHVSAKFTGGTNDGKEMVLVPENIATLRLNWMPGNGHSADIGAQWVDSQRYGDDFSNTCSSRMPSFTTVDARYAFRTGPWEFALAGSNLTDKDYFSNAFSCRGGIYPEAGRQLKLSVRYDF